MDSRPRKKQKLEDKGFNDLPVELKYQILMTESLDRKSLNNIKNVDTELYSIVKDPGVRKEQCWKKRHEWSMMKTPGNILSYMYENPEGTLLVHTSVDLGYISSKEPLYDPKTYIIWWDFRLGMVSTATKFGFKEEQLVPTDVTYMVSARRNLEFDDDGVKKAFKLLLDAGAIIGTDHKSPEFEFYTRTYYPKRYVVTAKLNDKKKIDPSAPIYDISFLSHKHCKDIITKTNALNDM